MAGPTPTLAEALACLRQGQAAQAEEMLGRLLQENPREPGARHLLGILLLQRGQPQSGLEQLDMAALGEPGVAAIHYNRGNALNALQRFDEAVDAFGAAVALKPDMAEAWFNRGNTLRRLGRDDEAMASYEQAVFHRPVLHQAHNAIGSLQLQRGQHEAALGSLGLALALEPRQPEALNNRGLALRALHRSGQALADFDRAIAIAPERAELFNNRGLTLQELGQAEAALESYDRSVALDPRSADAWSNRGGLLSAMQRHQEALESCGRAQALRPDHARALNNQGIALHGLQRIDEALTSYEHAIAAQPDFAEAWNNRGNALHDLRRHAEALAAFEQAIALRPGYAEAFNNRGMVRHELGQLDAARSDYDHAIALRPGYPEAYKRRAALSLLQGRLAEGWADYEATHIDVQRSLAGSDMIPFWEGQDLRGKSLLLSEPNGLGDTLQFFRFIPRLVERGASVSFLGPRASFRLLRTFAAPVRFVESREDGRFDYQCWLWSLPHHLRVHDFSGIAWPVPYLRAEPEREQRWSATLDPASFNIGICWQGNPARKIDAGRSIPVRAFAPLAGIPGVQLVSLQKHFGLDQLQDLPGSMSVRQLDGFDEGPDAFVDSAALLQGLDLLVSADTSITHVAGALGRPAWLALNTAPDWRWLLDRDDSPWYPSVRLFRQQVAGDWDEVFARMARALEPVVAERLASRRG
jgi:tetratricopeptide (TPR) repeat protein